MDRKDAIEYLKRKKKLKNPDEPTTEDEREINKVR